jgi:1,4-dihydroxy-2-naphthoate octaprenyltransferase
MGELITVSKSDPNFEKYLLGTFSKEKRALPVESLNVNTEKEEVTFNLVDHKEIEKPNFIIMWAQIFKFRNFILVLLPIFLVSTKNWIDETMQDPLIGLMGALGSVFLHASITLRNDFIDHIIGFARIHPQSGSRAIQKGWIRAITLKKLSTALMISGVLLGFPALLAYKEVLYVTVISLVLGFVGVMTFKSGLKLRKWSEIFSFFLLGPLLTIGYQGALGGGFDLEVIFIGILTGWFAVYYIHIKNFEMLMVNSKAKITNSISAMGFEKSKGLIKFWWIAWLLMVDLYHWVYCSHWWAYMMIFASILLTLPLVFSLNVTDSPVGSSMARTVKTARYLYIFLISLWALESSWYLTFF